MVAALAIKCSSSAALTDRCMGRLADKIGMVSGSRYSVMLAVLLLHILRLC